MRIVDVNGNTWRLADRPLRSTVLGVDCVEATSTERHPDDRFTAWVPLSAIVYIRE